MHEPRKNTHLHHFFFNFILGIILVCDVSAVQYFVNLAMLEAQEVRLDLQFPWSAATRRQPMKMPSRRRGGVRSVSPACVPPSPGRTQTHAAPGARPHDPAILDPPPSETPPFNSKPPQTPIGHARSAALPAAIAVQLPFVPPRL